jgi:16S rRNA C967 or C1407 C5-methylase (RsmB/RsmF family)
LDACAAPGGKTAHMLEKFKPQSLIALDQDSKRLLRVTENLQRLQLIKAMLRSLLRMQPRGKPIKHWIVLFWMHLVLLQA